MSKSTTSSSYSTRYIPTDDSNRITYIIPKKIIMGFDTTNNERSTLESEAYVATTLLVDSEQSPEASTCEAPVTHVCELYKEGSKSLPSTPHAKFDSNMFIPTIPIFVPHVHGSLQIKLDGTCVMYGITNVGQWYKGVTPKSNPYTDTTFILATPERPIPEEHPECATFIPITTERPIPEEHPEGATFIPITPERPIPEDQFVQSDTIEPDQLAQLTTGLLGVVDSQECDC